MKKCLRGKTVWYIGGGIISILVLILISTGIIIPGAGLIIGILAGLGLITFVSIAAIWDCWRKC